MTGTTENKKAREGDGEKTSFIHIKVTPSDKALWVRASSRSEKKNLAEWVTDVLNQAGLDELKRD